jgi:peptidoglycan hydrolase-like protein with peptidoglycan-binding domain
MKGAPVVLGVAAALAIGGAVWWSSAQKTEPKGGAPDIRAGTPGAAPKRNVVDRVVEAVRTGDPDVMRRLATELEAEGYTEQAMNLRRAADVAAWLNPRPGTPVTAGDPLRAPRVPRPWSPLPGLVEPMVVMPELDPARLEAQAVVRELSRAAPGKEDRELVRRFQGRNGLKASGNYTPATAMCIAEEYALVPPTPYWPTNGRVKAKANYKARLLAIAARDPQRAEEFRRAASKV